MINPIFVLRIPILSSAFVLDLHQAGSFLSSPPPEPSHKRTLSTLQDLDPESHSSQYCQSPGDLTTITHEIFVRFVPDYIINKTVFILLPPPECSLYVGQSYLEYNDKNELPP
ncbi:hypothetical protein CHARACLAT_024211 [Characodon lateralis]|uniref:Uncharacterized protein n=1 Tax=Characodon lateralis TaxID=208331 RepID=A0ABU7F603_9TELE|nr:hypothetical protein [Characodon lateralis]